MHKAQIFNQPKECAAYLQHLTLGLENTRGPNYQNIIVLNEHPSQKNKDWYKPV